MGKRGHKGTGGFSLLEIFIVVAILAILVTMGLPRISRGSKNPDDSSLSSSLRVLRNAIDLYAAEHGGRYPAASEIEGALTLYSDACGATSWLKTTSHIYGPYVRGIPPLPVGEHEGRTGISAADSPSTGWIYKAATGAIRANTTDAEKDDAGRPYNTY
jgi:type II secretory pathway pseudopilin PulG